MIELDKLIKWLDLIDLLLRYLIDWRPGNLLDACGKVIADTITILEEQKPVKPVGIDLDGMSTLYSCPDCTAQLLGPGQRYCAHCGRKFEWG